MKQILARLREYWLSLNKTVFLLTTILLAILIALNYTVGIEQNIVHAPLLYKLAGFYFLYAFVFTFAYWLQFYFLADGFTHDRFFYILLAITPVIFAVKIGYNGLPSVFTQNLQPPWNLYWNMFLDWPLKCLLMLLVLRILWLLAKFEKPVAGWSRKGLAMRPYLLLLLCMVPLITFAATQPDFLRVYPKLAKINFIYPHVQTQLPWNLLYELSYGSDFVAIETFFRGFLVLAFVRYVGKNSILPMAAFYCAIHFGKPLLECITSYFGGIILGVIVYYTRSIWGGLVVHLGIAWLMEVAGYIAHQGSF